MFGYKKSIGALVGNAMQFYDFTIYAFLASNISQEFFNFESKFLSYLVVFGVFAGGYLTRPIGSLVFGYFGDKNGRSSALSKTIILSTMATFLIGVIPGYKSVGFLSPLLLITLRLIQGLAVSGEEGGAVVLLFEKHSFKNRGLIGSVVLSSVLFGVIIGLLVCAITSQLISNNILSSWGWRLPFLLSLPLGIIAFLLRFILNDFKLFNLAETNNLLNKHPTKTLLHDHSWTVMYGFCIVAVYSITTSTLIVHLPYFLSVKNGFSHETSLMILAFAITMVAILTPFFGKICDKLCPLLIHNIALFGIIISSPILFYFISIHNIPLVIGSVVVFSAITALISSTVFSIIVGAFPFGVRYSGVSLSFNLSVTVFSSSTPMILVLIENYFDSFYAPGIYISVLASFFMIVIFTMQKKIHLENFNEAENESFIYDK